MQDGGVVVRFGFGLHRLHGDGGTRCHRGRQAGGLRTRAGHHRVVDERERLVDTGVHLHRGPTRVPGQRGD